MTEPCETDHREIGKTDLEKRVDAMQAELKELAERVRVDAVAEAFMRGERLIRQGDYFLLFRERPTWLSSVSYEGRWGYHDGRNYVEPHIPPKQEDHERLYTIAEVIQIIDKVVRLPLKSSK